MKSLTTLMASMVAVLLISGTAIAKGDQPKVALATHATGLSEPQQLIAKSAAEIKAVLVKDKTRLDSNPSHVYKLVDEILVPHVDLDRISGLILGKQWKRISEEQKKRFQNEFKQMLVRTYATAFIELDDWQIEFLSSKNNSSDNDILVRSKILRAGPPVKIDYRMRLNGDSWKVYDVAIEGVSLVTNYRSTFKKLIRKSGINGLISELAENNRKAVNAGLI